MDASHDGQCRRHLTHMPKAYHPPEWRGTPIEQTAAHPIAVQIGEPNCRDGPRKESEQRRNARECEETRLLATSQDRPVNIRGGGKA